LTPQNQDLGGRSPPPPEGESGQRNQIGQQPQNDLEYHNHGSLMPHQLYAGIDCPDRINADHRLGPGIPDPPVGTLVLPVPNSCHRRGESYAVRAKRILGGLHHEYSLALAYT